MDNKNTLYCSFCGKSQNEVKKLIAGPTVFICDECVFLCFEIIVGEKVPVPDALAEQARALVREQAGADFVSVVKRILAHENRYHAPFIKLEEALRIFETTEEPTSESTQPATIEKFPEAIGSSQSD